MLVPMAEEVREAQERLIAEFDNDFQRYCQFLQKQQKKQNDRM